MIQSDLFGRVKWPFQGVKWPPTRGWKGHFESPGVCVFVFGCYLTPTIRSTRSSRKFFLEFLRISLLWRVALFIRPLGEKGWSWGVFLWWDVWIYYPWWVQKFVSFSTSLSMKPYGKTTTYSRNIKWLAGVLNHQQVLPSGSWIITNDTNQCLRYLMNHY